MVLLLRTPRGHPSAIFLNVQEKCPLCPLPPADCYTKGDVLFSFAEAVAAGRQPGSAKGVRLGRMPVRPTLYHTLVPACGRASHRRESQNMGENCLPIGGSDQVDGFGFT